MRGPQRKTNGVTRGRVPPPGGRARDEAALYQAVAALKTADEARRFMADLATPAEIEAFAERWRIARMLDAGEGSYRDIAAETGASTATVARVARFLRDDRHAGYRLMINRLNKRK